MSSPNSTSNVSNPTATRDNGKAPNVEKLAEGLSGIIGKTLATESPEALLLDAIGALGERLRSVEGESDNHDARLHRLETAMRFVHPKQASTRTEADEDRADVDFEILRHISEVKTTISKSGLRNMDPDAADAIWRSVDSIQQLIDREVVVDAAAAA